jgi:3-hydroxyacyl-CoA dehydrogenase/enoyl-CoA hydratase/3-hydroxybutyryl-CoA epimerase
MYMSSARLEIDSQVIGTIWLNAADKKVNALSRQMWADLSACIEQAARSNVVGLIITSAKQGTFIVGADLFELRDMSDVELDEYLVRGQRILQRLESLTIPTTAAINGDCLGGGLEVALACKCRVCVDEPSIRIGFPETKVGLVPGWGGTVRTHKLVGLEHALPLVALGDTIDPQQAMKMGLVDAVVPMDQLMTSARQHRAQPARKDNAGDTRRIFTWAEEKVRAARSGDELLAPMKVVQIMRDTITHGEARGYDDERQALIQLRRSPAGEKLLNAFFARQAAKKQG